jgi:hypothetical protein
LFGYSEIVVCKGLIFFSFVGFLFERKKYSGRERSMAGGPGGAAPPPKQEELQPHPVRDQLPSISYCITSPPPWRECLFNLIDLKDIYLVYTMNITFSVPLKKGLNI